MSGPPAPPADDFPVRRLRRSRTDRVAGGLCGGLGRYFGVDPVLFRVALAVLALFGGSGVVLYLIGWLAVPEDDAANAPIDRLVARLRNHSWPFAVFAVVVALAILAVWRAVFRWWSPFSIFPAVLVIIAIVVLLARRDRATTGTPPTPVRADGATDVIDDLAPPPLEPAGVQLRSWLEESRARSRERRRRSAPLRWTAWGLVVAAVTGLAIADATSGIRFGVYFWVVGGIVVGSLLVGLIARRAPWSVAVLLLPALIGVVSFGTSPASAHDGAGQRTWTPVATADLRDEYRFAFGRGTLDLTRLAPLTQSRTVTIVQGAGQLRLLLSRSLPVRVEVHLHQGEIQVDGSHRDDGWNVSATYDSPAITATGGSTAGAPAAAVLTLDTDLTAGQVDIVYV